MNKIKGGLSDTKTLMDIAKETAKKENNKNIDEIYNQLKLQLKKGIKVEFEHTSDKKVAKEIATDHLSENPKYYDMLGKIEKKFESKYPEGSRALNDPEFPRAGGENGVYVKIDDKCKKFPYCNQGDINAIKPIGKNKKIKITEAQLIEIIKSFI